MEKVQLIRSVEASVYQDDLGSTRFIKSISGEIQSQDYIKIFDFSIYSQNFSRAEETSNLTIPQLFGLAPRNNTQQITLEINY